MLGIIYFEKFGSDKKRTLINKLVSLICQFNLEFVIFASSTSLLRCIRGPFSLTNCYLQLFFRNVYLAQQLISLNSVLLSRYIFIFYLKNPLAFQDEFWSLFVNIWIRLSTFIFHLALFQLPGIEASFLSICSGTKPDVDKKKIMNSLNVNLLVPFTIINHIVVLLRIHFYKRKTIRVEQMTTRYPENSATNLYDVTTSVAMAGLFLLTGSFIVLSNKLTMEDYMQTKWFIFNHFFFLCWPPVFFTIIGLLYYLKHEELRKFIMEEIKKKFLDSYSS